MDIPGSSAFYLTGNMNFVIRLAQRFLFVECKTVHGQEPEQARPGLQPPHSLPASGTRPDRRTNPNRWLFGLRKWLFGLEKWLF
jgi:hypothetical protein